MAIECGVLNCRLPLPRVADGLDEAAVLVVLHDARVEVAVGDEDVALLIEGDVGLPAEAVLLIAAVEAARARHSREHRHRILAPPDRHQHLAFGAELDEHVGALVDGPDVVLGVDANRVREREPVVVAADLADELAGRRVLEQARLVRAVVDVDVALRVGGDAHVLAGVDARRVLEEIRDRLVGDHGHVGRGGAALSRQRRKRQRRGGKREGAEGPGNAWFHRSLRTKGGWFPNLGQGAQSIREGEQVQQVLQASAYAADQPPLRLWRSADQPTPGLRRSAEALRAKAEASAKTEGRYGGPRQSSR